MMEKIVKQKGKVELSFEDSHIVDIDIKPGTENFNICFDITMQDTKKSFPDVKFLMISRNVNIIKIPNSLFPNVRKIISKSIAFSSGKYLVRRGLMNTLSNTFCRSVDEEIDLDGILQIDKFAFDGCESLKVLNSKRVCKCEKDAFAGSALIKQPFVNGLKMAGSIVIDVDKSLDVIDLPDEKEPITHFAVDVSDVKNMVSHGKTFIEEGLGSVPQNLTLDVKDSEFTVQNLNSIMKHKTYDNVYIKNIHIADETQKLMRVKSVGDFVYNKTMKVVVCSKMEIDNVVIPEGVEKILEEAFDYTRIKSLTTPSSLRLISSYAFAHCDELESVSFNNGLREISRYAFLGCSGLRHITLPKSLKKIGPYAFSYSNVESVVLNDGLQVIEKGAFQDTFLKEIAIPASVNRIGHLAFPDSLEVVNIGRYSEGIVSAFIDNREDTVITLRYAGKELDIPRRMSDSLRNEFFDNAKEYFTNHEAKRFSICKYVKEPKSREDFAWYEYDHFDDVKIKEAARRCIKEQANVILFEATHDFDEEKVVKLVKADILSDDLKEWFLDEEEANEMPIAKSYILESLKKNNVNNFDV